MVLKFNSLPQIIQIYGTLEASPDNPLIDQQ